MKIPKSKFGLRLLTGLCACGWMIAVAGCGGPRTVPVSGVATLNGKPLDRGIVFYHPDASKGNNLRLGCRGTIAGDGHYELFTEDLSKVYKGAPVGWYKVTIVALVPGNDTPIPVNQKYTQIDNTPLVIEVVDKPEPGRYDLKFTK
jgi:hypothetical protein